MCSNVTLHPFLGDVGYELNISSILSNESVTKASPLIAKSFLVELTIVAPLFAVATALLTRYKFIPFRKVTPEGPCGPLLYSLLSFLSVSNLTCLQNSTEPTTIPSNRPVLHSYFSSVVDG